MIPNVFTLPCSIKIFMSPNQVLFGTNPTANNEQSHSQSWSNLAKGPSPHPQKSVSRCSSCNDHTIHDIELTNGHWNVNCYMINCIIP